MLNNNKEDKETKAHHHNSVNSKINYLNFNNKEMPKEFNNSNKNFNRLKIRWISCKILETEHKVKLTNLANNLNKMVKTHLHHNKLLVPCNNFNNKEINCLDLNLINLLITLKALIFSKELHP